MTPPQRSRQRSIDKVRGETFVDSSTQTDPEPVPCIVAGEVAETTRPVAYKACPSAPIHLLYSHLLIA